MRLEGTYPEPDELKSALEALRVPLNVVCGREPQLRATLVTPNGMFVIGSEIEAVSPAEKA